MTVYGTQQPIMPSSSATSSTEPGIVTYQQFRRHATFCTDHADFVVDEPGLRRLLADAELLWAGSGLGVGDLAVLARGAAGLPAFTCALSGAAAPAAQARRALVGKPGLALTYTAVVKVCRVLKERADKVRHELTTTTEQQNINHLSTTTDHHHHHHSPQHQQGGSQLERFITAFSVNPSPSPQRSVFLSSTADVDTARTAQGEQGTAGHSGATGGTSAVRWWEQELPGRHPTRSSLPQRPSTAPHPSSSSCHTRPASGHTSGHSHHQPISLLSSLPTHASHFLNRQPPASAVTLRPMSAMVTRHDPTQPPKPLMELPWATQPLQPPAFTGRLLQEVVRKPQCDFPAVARMLSGVQALRDEGSKHAHLVLLELKAIATSWEAALRDKAVKDFMRTNKNAGDSELPAAPQLRGEGVVWVLLHTAGALLSQDRPLAAGKALEAAREAYDQEKLGDHHTYLTAIKLCQGLVHHHLGQYSAAASVWGEAAESGTRVATVTLDPLTRRNAGAAANNQGCALLMMGDRVAAVRCFRAAVAALRHAPNDHTMSLGQELTTNQVVDQLPTLPQGPPSPTSHRQLPPPPPQLSVTDPQPPNPAEQPSPDPAAPPPETTTQPPIQVPLPAFPTSRPTSPSKATAAAARGSQQGGKGGAQAGAPAPLGLDAPAAQLAMYNLQGAMRQAFALGPVPVRPGTAAAFPSAMAARLEAATATASDPTAAANTFNHPGGWQLAPEHPLRTLRAKRSNQQQATDPNSLANNQTDPTASPNRSLLTTGSAARSMTAFAAVQLTATAAAGHAHRPLSAGAGGVGAFFASGSGRLACAGADTDVTGGGGDTHGDALRGSRTGPLRTFLAGAITAKPPTAPTAPPPYASRVTAAMMEGKGKGKGKGGKDGKDSSKKKDGKKGDKKKKKDSGFKISYPGDYYDPPIYSVANVKAEAPKKKKASAAKLKKK